MKSFLSLFVILLCATSAASENRVSIVTDLPALALIASEVADGTGVSVKSIIDGSADPHHYSLRPSDAQAIESASIVIWGGEAISPWMTKAAPDGSINVLEVPGTTLLKARHGANFGSHDHSDDLIDPHAWLYPENAMLWAAAIARRLTEIDAEKRETFLGNAMAFERKTRKLTADLVEAISEKPVGNYVLDHDSFQYFELRFGLLPLAAFSDAEGHAPGPRRLGDVKQRSADADCFIAQPDSPNNRGILLGIEKTVVVDATGASAQSYQEIIENVALGYMACKAD